MSLSVPKDDRDDHSVSSDSPLQPSGFVVTPAELTALHDPKSLRKLHELGGLEHLAKTLQSDPALGLDAHADTEDRVQRYGRNQLPVKTAKSFFVLCYEAMKDKVLILLTVAAVISLALGLYETFGQETEYDDENNAVPKVDWVEGVAIITAVVIVVVVGAANDFQKERQFAKLNSKKEDRQVIVFRNGNKQMVSIHDLLVGDVISLETGDVVPADSVMISGDIECDESALTGELDTIHKKPAAEALGSFEKHIALGEDIGSATIKFQDPFLISGARVLSGFGTALVTAVGSNSIHGRTMASLSLEAEVTPLQARLDDLAEGISKYGFLAALVLFVVLFIRFCVNIAPGGSLANSTGPEKGKSFVEILIVAVTIVVVAVPEGLPLAVTLALAFATTRMAQNGNLVRVLRSCEIMGGATAICSDKTGTLTENRMRIVRGYINKKLAFDDSYHAGMTDSVAKSADMVPQIPAKLKVFISSNITLNSTAFENSDYDEEAASRALERPKQRSFFYHLFHSKSQTQQSLGANNEPYLGNKTESALLIFAKNKFNQFTDNSLTQQRNDSSSEIVQVIPFESSRKWAGVVMKIDNGYRFYIKGAAEILFRHCSFQVDDHDNAFTMERSDREAVLEKIDEYANDALRAIMLAHKDFVGISSWPPAEIADPKNPSQALPKLLVDIATSRHDSVANLVMDFLVGLQDPLKEGVAEAVSRCKMAGVTVRMVTGDNLTTAKAISRGCNILTPEDSSNENAFMEGPAFRALSQEERTRIAPLLRVLARSSPEDKRILVDTLRKAGEVVAVTGDGTNDAPALKLADVGFSMGISGTEVAREASDIILMTDDFTDIVQAIKWGRTVAESIKKFIQFQLTVNITACVLTFVSAVASPDGKSVLTAVQLLWVNLIMDTLAALALATDKPDDALLNRKPAGRTMPLISVSMWKMILGQSINQLIVTFVLHFAGQKIFYGDSPITTHQQEQLDAMTFNAFVWLQFWKLFVTRKLDECADVTTVRGRINLENLNFFSHLFRNWYFIVITVLIGAMQVLIMFVGGAAFTIVRQTPAMWATAIICGMVSVPVGMVIRIVPNWWVVKIFPTRAFNAFLYYAGFGWMSKKARKERAAKDLEKNIKNSEETVASSGLEETIKAT
ncbi:Ca2+-transporting P-type ATPase [Metschnikowia bicuspidata var. bicuspidata NRRL YB-4993]|uniref:P-type Ca(2+) transporter n=1 Tax=Metschnikowia bicuspidata var. bicuspidata NRRL YB-4993 TaxID=869754 RepID=A0A1A0H7B5_9ASCO|nr:Ca2+-transporting P-type ATPase [Metschnikowia bicuspidata var. bicuspidata NRRL YB-4993]OBA19870.1 Ca2+-transporting P-type ATPase [Metschnikowia bicuspidata var. bicuspidata NRRL YB-4993]